MLYTAAQYSKIVQFPPSAIYVVTFPKASEMKPLDRDLLHCLSLIITEGLLLLLLSLLY